MFQAGNFCVGNTQSWALALDSGQFWILHRICLIFWFWISAISLLSHWLKTKFPGFWLALQGISHKDEINLQIKKRSRSRVDIYLRPLFRNISVANYKIFSDFHNWKTMEDDEKSSVFWFSMYVETQISYWKRDWPEIPIESIARHPLNTLGEVHHVCFKILFTLVHVRGSLVHRDIWTGDI